MYKHSLIFIGLVTILFVLLQPNLFVKIPIKYNMYFVFFHCLIFAFAFCFINKVANTSLENFSDQEKDFFEKKRQEIHKAFEKYSTTEIDGISDKDIQNIVTPIISDLSEDQKRRLQEYSEQMLKTNTTITSDKPIKYMHNDELQKKMDFLGATASVEQIQLFDGLPKNQQNALEQIVDSMNMEDIKKYLELDIEKLKKSLMDVISLNFK